MPVSASDDRIYLSTISGSIYAWDFGTGQLQLMSNTGLQLTDIGIAPDGRFYGITSSQLYEIDPATGQSTLIGALSSPTDLYYGVSALTGANALDISSSGVARVGSANNSVIAGLDLSTGQVSNNALLTRSQSAGDIWFTDDNNYVVSTTSYNLAFFGTSTLGNELVSDTQFVLSNAIFGLVGAPEAGYGVNAGTLLGFIGNTVYNLEPGNTILGPGLATLGLPQGVSGAAVLRAGQGAGQGGGGQGGTPPTTSNTVQFQLNDIKDSYITSVFSSQDSENLLVGGWGDYYYSMLQFDVSTMPDAVDSVTMRLYVDRQAVSPWSYPQMSLWTVSGNWTEGMSWSQNATQANFVRNIGAAQGVGWFDIDITDVYRQWKSGALANDGIQLRPLTNTANQTYFASSESTNAANRPVLVIDPADTGGGTSGGTGNSGDILLETGSSAWVDVAGQPGVQQIVNPTGFYITNRTTNTRLLRIEGGTVTQNGATLTVEGAAVYDGFANISEPLFTGDFQLDMAQFANAGPLTPLTATGFREVSPTAYTLGQDYRVQGQNDVTFSSLALQQDRVVLGADVVFSNFFNFSTQGSPLKMTLTSQGAKMGVGTIGGVPLAFPTTTFALPISGMNVGLTFTEFGFLNDTVSETSYLFGKGDLSWSMNGYDWTFNFDLSSTPDATTGLLAPTENYIRYSQTTGLDVVGTFTLSQTESPLLRSLGHLFSEPAAGLTGFTLSVDTVQNAHSISGGFNLPGLGVTLNLGASFQWDPLSIYAFQIGFDGADVPILGSPIFLNGGTLSVGQSTPTGPFSISGQARASFGPSSSALLRGTLDGSFSEDGIGAAVSVSAKARYILDGATVDALQNGQSTSNPLVSAMQTFLGVNLNGLLDWDFATVNGSLDWRTPAQGLDISADISLLGGILTGQADFVLDFNNSWSFQTTVAATMPNIGAMQLFRGASVDANVYVTYSDDGNAANDKVMVWTDLNLPFPVPAALSFGFSNAFGFYFALDGSYGWLGSSEIALIGSWQLDPSMPWAIMTAHWDNASTNTQLVVITPDGQRLTEADIAARSDISIVDSLSSPNSRSVAVQTPATGIWDIEVASSDTLGNVTYEANQGAPQADISIGAVSFDPITKQATVDVTTTGATAATDVRLFVDSDAQGANGAEITTSSLDLSSGSARYTWDFSGATPGLFYVYGVADHPGAPVDIAYSTGQVEVIAYSGDNEVYGTAAAETLLADAADQSFDAVAAQVFRLYQATLARAPDLAGHLGWTNNLLGGADINTVVDGFINSAEFTARYGGTQNREFVTLLYNNVLNRPPDTAGLDGWAGHLDAGTRSRAEIVRGFSDSGEFQITTAADVLPYTRAGYQAGYSDDVFRLYRATLDREPDATGFGHWTAQLAQGTAFAQVVSGFIGSPEFQAVYGNLDNESFVQLLYLNVLNRSGDQAGITGWLSQLDQGRSRADIVAGFSQSQEFTFGQEPLLRAWMRDQTIDDYLDGRAGDDILFGGAMPDMFKFSASDSGNDRLADFELWDTLILQGFGFADAQTALNGFTQDGTDAVLTHAAGEIRLLDVQASDLDADNILLL